MSELLDRDAVWTPDDALDQVVLEMSRDLDLPRDWMNDRVRPMLPRVVDSGQAEVLTVVGLTVSVASSRHMIAMKARAARDARDLDDLALLCRQAGVGTVEGVLEIAEAVWGQDMLRDETVFALREGLRERGISS